jgi:hypothetical protein
MKNDDHRLPAFQPLGETMLNTLSPLRASALCSGPVLRLVLGALTLAGLLALPPHAEAAQRSFDSPEAGAAALADAVQSNDSAALRAIFGNRKLVSSGDPVADAANRAAFLAAYSQGHRIVTEGRQAELRLGEQAWPLPIPLVQSTAGRWHFDTRQGESEVLSRRIGRNELAAIQVCQAIVDAQREFAARDSDGDGLREYAAKMTSAPGQRDGLYWPTAEDEALSPLGPLLAAAAQDGYLSANTGSLEPYHGYFYKILTRQGTYAPGGGYDYFVQGQMVSGFALLAWPARYGASGIMSFLVNQEGRVYQKNLGRKTSVLAAALSSFNPDTSWKRVTADPD